MVCYISSTSMKFEGHILAEVLHSLVNSDDVQIGTVSAKFDLRTEDNDQERVAKAIDKSLYLAEGLNSWEQPMGKVMQLMEQFMSIIGGLSEVSKGC